MVLVQKNTSYLPAEQIADKNLVWTFLEMWDLPSGKREYNFYSCTVFLLKYDKKLATFVTVSHGINQLQVNQPDFKYKDTYYIGLINYRKQYIAFAKDHIKIIKDLDIAFIEVPVGEIDSSIQFNSAVDRIIIKQNHLQKNMAVYVLGFPFNRQDTFSVFIKNGFFKGTMTLDYIEGKTLNGTKVYATDILPTFGFSGDPIISDRNGQVLGMLFSSWKKSQNVKLIAYPINLLIENCNE